MKREIAFLFCLLIGATDGPTHGNATSGSLSEAHEAGKAFSGQSQGDGLESIREGQGMIPVFESQPQGNELQGDLSQAGLSPSGLYEGADLSAATAAAKSEARSFIEASKASRQHFTFDTQTDPLFVRSESVVEEAHVPEAKVPESSSAQTVAESETVQVPAPTSSTHECIESTAPIEASCTSTLMIEAHLKKGKTKVWGCVAWETQINRYKNGNREVQWYTYGIGLKACTQWRLLEWGNEGKCAAVNDKHVCKKFTPSFQKTLAPAMGRMTDPDGRVRVVEWEAMEKAIFYSTPPSGPQIEPDQVIVTEERWVDSCGSLESLSDSGVCAYVSKVCTQGPETRTINGASIYRDCWQYTSTYTCEHPKKEGCKALRERGCFQVGSSCHEQTAQGCVSYKQTYRCEDLSRTIKGKRGQNNLGLFCADGACADTSYTANKDMLESISKLQILKEVSQDRAGEPFGVFKGSDQRCSKSCLSFSDCCGLSGGWGETVKMTQCSGEEKDLGTRRKKGLCQLVGTYCAEKEKITGICLRKKTSYCCFSSKLARLFQTQGRAQLGMGWGSGENPNCRGFTVEELTKIDFSKLDTREIFSEISARYKPGNQVPDLQTKTLHSIETNMKQVKEGLNGKGL